MTKVRLVDFFIARAFIWRLGRKLYSFARQEISDNFYKSGEYWLLSNVLLGNEEGQDINLIDIGVYLGGWTQNASTIIQAQSIDNVVIHSFEPSEQAFLNLSQKFKENYLIRLYNIALSDRTGELNFYTSEEDDGTNSLLNFDHKLVSKVNVTRLDDFVDTNDINHILMIKSDTEGNDFNVLLGGSNSLTNGLIDVWQFEYNHRWISGRFFLKDVFDFIKGKPYKIGKLLHNRIETYQKWHPELERFFEANFVLIKIGSRFEHLCVDVGFDKRNVLVKKTICLI